ncbi:MAG: PrsW family intramembrane metalloprotease [Propionibacteriaceae bacterium]|nr:PrsW family intramembrane metalloprotease [Propionibacteriaceae bacterium]
MSVAQGEAPVRGKKAAAVRAWLWPTRTARQKALIHARRWHGVPVSDDLPVTLKGMKFRQVLALLARLVVHSKWTWIFLILLAGYAACGLVVYFDLGATQTYEDGSFVPGLNDDALVQSAKYALPTLAFWTILYLLIDRFRPQRLIVWALALGWGGLAAMCFSLYANTWAASQMAVLGLAPGMSDPRPAIYIAPFIEEASKGTILFIIAFLARDRIVSAVSGVVLGALAGAGFAFSENIVYYARAIVYGSYTASTGDLQAAVRELVLLRGLYTCFGHPTFTAMIGLGLAVGVRHRSKIVRVIAPAAGFLAAALLHMLFNGISSIVSGDALIYVYLLFGLPFAIGTLILVIRTAVRQARLIRERLGDYVVMGWLPQRYPALFASLKNRIWSLLMSPWYGSVIATWRLQQAVTELAYLRDRVTRGVVGDGGRERERELIGVIRRARAAKGLETAAGLRPYLWRRKTRPVVTAGA